jgi:putative sterol carrier protein
VAVFKDAEEIYQFIGGIFEEAFADPVVGEEFAKSGVVLKLHYTEPQAVFTVDMPEQKVIYGAEGPKPSVEMFMKADVAHQFWLGKVNVSMALAKGQMRAKGSIPKILKLVPIAKRLFPKYQGLLEKAGRADLAQAS